MTRRARSLRRSMTDAERILWARLRDRSLAGFKFRRQLPIDPFVADFACMERRLIVEVDGGQHAQDTSADRERSRVLAAHGYTVLRFWNSEVLHNLEGVLAVIAAALLDREHRPHPDVLSRPSPRPSPRGRGGGK